MGRGIGERNRGEYNYVLAIPQVCVKRVLAQYGGALITSLINYFLNNLRNNVFKNEFSGREHPELILYAKNNRIGEFVCLLKKIHALAN